MAGLWNVAEHWVTYPIVERQQTVVIHYTVLYLPEHKHENFNSHKSQTMDFRLAYCFFLCQ